MADIVFKHMFYFWVSPAAYIQALPIVEQNSIFFKTADMVHIDEKTSVYSDKSQSLKFSLTG